MTFDPAGDPAGPQDGYPGSLFVMGHNRLPFTENVERSLTGYQHPDEWEGGAWLTTPAGRSAVVFAGTKATGSKYWYGYVNPAGAELPCVEEEMVAQFTTCRLANGQPCPAEDLFDEETVDAIQDILRSVDAGMAQIPMPASV